MKKALFILTSYFLLLTPALALAQSVDLIWEGDGYTPPFYQGRTLWVKQGVVNILAIPHGLGAPATLNYKWTRSGTVLGNTNGIGQNSLSLQDSVISRPQTIKVEILSAGEDVLASASVVLTPTSPFLTVYEIDPLYGFMFHKEVPNSHLMKENEVSFAAFPFFFTVDSRSDNTLRYSWLTNGAEAETMNMVTYRMPENTTGSSAISARVSHSINILQEAGKNFLVQFGAQ